MISLIINLGMIALFALIFFGLYCLWVYLDGGSAAELGRHYHNNHTRATAWVYELGYKRGERKPNLAQRNAERYGRSSWMS